MKLEVSRLALQTIATLRPLVARIRRYDRSLAVQLVRAASSLALNLGEGEYSDPGTKRARYCNAAGSANETRTALAVAVAWGYVFAHVTSSVHPRACGDHTSLPDLAALATGSSPRVRGPLRTRARRPRTHRFIPARAGTTSTQTSGLTGRTVHPRACGDHHDSLDLAGIVCGSSPRVRGPQVPLEVREAFARVHPRACGDHYRRQGVCRRRLGSSPRVRGPRLHALVRSFQYTVHPRACGDHARRCRCCRLRCGSSPRVRGPLEHALA